MKELLTRVIFLGVVLNKKRCWAFFYFDLHRLKSLSFVLFSSLLIFLFKFRKYVSYLEPNEFIKNQRKCRFSFNWRSQRYLLTYWCRCGQMFIYLCVCVCVWLIYLILIYFKEICTQIFWGKSWSSSLMGEVAITVSK